MQEIFFCDINVLQTSNSSLELQHCGRSFIYAKDCEDGAEKPKKGNIIELNKYIDKAIRVKFTGGREVVGILKGYDQLVNVVLDDTEEYLRDPVDPYKVTEKTRTLGLTVIRGTSVLLISPVEGTQEIPNPFNSEQKAVI